MSKALEAAARAVAKAHGCGRGTSAVCWGCRCKAYARAAILAFLREVNASDLGAAVRDAEDPTHAAIARALIKALTRLAEGRPAHD